MSSDEVAQAIAKLADEVRALREGLRRKPAELLTVSQYAKIAKMTEPAVRAAIARRTLDVERGPGRRVRVRWTPP